MKVREIELGDVFLASKLLKKIDIRKLMTEVGVMNVTGMTVEERDAAMKEKGVDFFMALLAHLDEAEKEIMALIGAWTNMTPQEAAKIKLSEIKDFADQFVKVNGSEAISRFFEKAASLMQQKR